MMVIQDPFKTVLEIATAAEQKGLDLDVLLWSCWSQMRAKGKSS
jgi:hypothetical protein